jgi:ankyrin repeat protein
MNPKYEDNSLFYSLHHLLQFIFFSLLFTIRAGDVGCVKVLLAAGAKVDAEAKDKGESEYGRRTDTVETALHIAVTEKKVEIAELLIEAG